MPITLYSQGFSQQYPNPVGAARNISYPIPSFETMFPREHARDFRNIENRVNTNVAQIRANVAIHEPTLNELGITYDVIPHLQQSGLCNLAIFAEKNVNPLTIEFLASIKPEYDTFYDCIAWSYRIGGVLFTQDKRSLCLLFGFLLDGAVPSYSHRERRRFYRHITGMNDFTPDCSPARIDNHAWRFIHLFISTNIYPRMDNGTSLTSKDLDLMIAIYKREQVDYFEILTSEIEQMRNNWSYDQVIGAGAFASTLALYHGFSLDNLEGTSLIFDTPFLVNKAVLYPNSVEWIVIPESEEYEANYGAYEEEGQGENHNWEDNNQTIPWENTNQVNQEVGNNNIQDNWGNGWIMHAPPIPPINDYIPAPPEPQENGFVPAQFINNGELDAAVFSIIYPHSENE